MRALDIKPGDKFGRWTVLSTNQHLPNRECLYCYCVCDCGNVGFVTNVKLTHGISKSCGCGRRKYPKDENGNNLCNSRFYHIWRSMNKRCFDPNSPAYKDYGGRGITVCDEWHNDLLAFVDWATSNGYQDDLTIDRIDNNGNYCPENCRWATMETQNNNTRKNVYFTLDGKTQTISQWSRETGITISAIHDRIKYGWSVERMLTEPVDTRRTGRRKKVQTNG